MVASRTLLALAAAGSLLAGCVAPEEPPPRVVSKPPTVAAPASASLEDAPVPNRQMRGPSGSVIRVQK